MLNKKKLGDILIEADYINQKDLERALDNQKKSNMRLGEVLIDLGMVTEEDIANALEKQLPHLRLNSNKEVDENLLKEFNREFLYEYKIFPLRLEGDYLVLAMQSPQNVVIRDEIKENTGYDISPRIATPTEINNLIEDYYEEDFFNETVDEITFETLEDEEEDNNIDTNELEDKSSKAPIIRLVNKIIAKGVNLEASDIHIEPLENKTRIRYRIDGVLHEKISQKKNIHNAIVSRIKIMADLDIAERRTTQDGRIQARINNRKIDLRISTLPSIRGEKVVIRILDKSNLTLDFNSLGFFPEDLKKIKKMANIPNGIILLTGPTGSGKTTTLYTILNYLNNPHDNIITVEDPVEYKLSGITQVSTNKKKNLTFANVLRNILRQDPDKIMVGEIRDKETAKIAIQGALTGHLVLSTLHTNTAIGAINRLIDMGIEDFLVSSALTGVISQRLVRTLCPKCKVKSDNEKYKGQGCSYCKDIGYKGRTAIYEILSINDDLKEGINKNLSEKKLLEIARKKDFSSLKEVGLKKVEEGNTTLEEIKKVSRF